MKILFLDIATHTSSSLDASSGMIACVDDDRIVSSITIDDRMSDADLLPAVEGALKNADWTYADLTQIACVIGPGGFTSLRMGVSLANALADQLSIPSAGIHLSDLYAARAGFELWALSDEQQKNFQNSQLTAHSSQLLWIHSTKKTELFVRGFGALASQWPESTLIGLEEFHQAVPHGVSIAGELITSQREFLADCDLKPAPIRPIADVLPSFLLHLSYKNDLLLPWYGRSW